jgi:hypothetical protein
MNFESMNATSVMTASHKSRALTPRLKMRRGAKGLLAHLREQTVSFPPVRRHRLPSK